VVWEVLTQTILLVAWLPRVTAETLRELLRPVKDFLEHQGLPVLATLSDKQSPLEKALTTLWPEVRHQWCQAHFLRNLAQPLYKRDLALKTELRQQVRTRLRVSLREVAAQTPQGTFSPSGGHGPDPDGGHPEG
jgi:hypothetical protein